MSPDKNKYPYCSYTLHSERKTLKRRVDSEQMYHLLNVTVVLGATVPRVETLRVRAPPTAPPPRTHAKNKIAGSPDHPVCSTRFMGLQHAISSGFSGHYQDLGNSSLKLHEFACMLAGQRCIPTLRMNQQLGIFPFSVPVL